ncbi:MAG TPA: J domain-containing protein [Acidimicrobiales bacterium]|nr:J domain-containing protein [Acidimicrobiales bacterium]
MGNDDRSGELYQRLGVPPGATHDEVVRAYRRLVPGAHPDAQPGDPDASRRFRELTEAYDVLADPVRRAHYDLAEGAHHPGPPAGVGGAASQALRPPVDQAPRPPVDLGRAAAPTVVGPLPARLPPLWAGPVHVEPDGVAQGARRPDELTDAVLALVSRVLATGRWW